MTKIGRRLVSVFAAGTALLAAAAMLITCIMFRSEAIDSLRREAGSGISLIEEEMASLSGRAAEIGSHMAADEDILRALAVRDKDRLAEIFGLALYDAGSGGDNTAFCCAVAPDGGLVWESSPGRITDIAADPENEGLFADSSGVLYYRKDLFIGNSGNALIIGYDIADKKFLEKLKKKTGCEVCVFKNSRMYASTVMNSDGTSPVGTEMDPQMLHDVAGDHYSYSGTIVIGGQKYECSCVPFNDSEKKYTGAYLACISRSDADGYFLKVVIIAGASVIVIFAVFAVILVRTLKRTIIAPAAEAGRFAADLKNGDLGADDSVSIPLFDDEMGRLVNDICSARQMLGIYVSDLTQLMSAMSRGDFTLTAQADYIGDFSELKKYVSLINEEMRDILAAVGRSADQVHTGSEQSASGSQALAGGATRQAAAIEQLSASLSDISEGVRSTAENAEEARRLSEEAAEKMNSQHEHMSSMLEAMNEISEKSSEIGKIIRAINDIAFQTNMLALNAAVEAARAGESGRGFAVVADEVRMLASKCSQAVSTTSELVEATSKAVERGERIADMNAESLTTVKQIFDSTSNIINEISSAADHQAQSIGQITGGINEISSVVQENSAAAEQIAASCEQLNGQSEYLRDSMKKFKVK